MSMTYGTIRQDFPDRDSWILSNILSHQAQRQPRKVFLSQPGLVEYTYAAIDQAATRIATGLRELGLRKGDRILIYMENRAEYVLTWFGAARAGVVEVPTNVDYFGEYLDHAISLTSPSAFVTTSQHLGKLMASLERLRDFQAPVIMVGDDTDRDIRTLKKLGLPALRLSDLLAAERDTSGLPTLHRSEPGAIIFTSGTTGASKGVTMSHNQLHFFASQTVDLTQLTDSDVYLTANPLFHGNAQFVTTYPALIVGGAVALYEKFSPSKWIGRVRESGATVTNFLGVMMEWILQQPEVDDEIDNQLRCIFAAPTPFNLIESFSKRFGRKVFVEGYGQTETCMPFMTPYGMSRPEGAAGLGLTEWFDIRLADAETDEEVGIGEVGEVQLRPKEDWIVNLGYFNMPEATASARRNLWFHTGDGAKVDEEGWYYFVDRLKDTIRRRGENISSFAIEQVFIRHPAVGECAAVGVPADEQAGEDEIEVWVIPSEGATIDPEELVEWSKDHLPHFIVPRYLQVAEELPTTPSGKVQKAKLRAKGVDGAWDRMKGDARLIQVVNSPPSSAS